MLKRSRSAVKLSSSVHGFDVSRLCPACRLSQAACRRPCDSSHMRDGDSNLLSRILLTSSDDQSPFAVTAEDHDDSYCVSILMRERLSLLFPCAHTEHHWRHYLWACAICHVNLQSPPWRPRYLTRACPVSRGQPRLLLSRTHVDGLHFRFEC